VIWCYTKDSGPALACLQTQKPFVPSTPTAFPRERVYCLPANRFASDDGNELRTFSAAGSSSGNSISPPPENPRAERYSGPPLSRAGPGHFRRQNSGKCATTFQKRKNERRLSSKANSAESSSSMILRITATAVPRHHRRTRAAGRPPPVAFSNRGGPPCELHAPQSLPGSPDRNRFGDCRQIDSRRRTPANNSGDDNRLDPRNASPSDVRKLGVDAKVFACGAETIALNISRRNGRRRRPLSHHVQRQLRRPVPKTNRNKLSPNSYRHSVISSR